MEGILNITLKLPDGRIMMSRQAPEKKWSISVEKKLKAKESALAKFNEVMWDMFGIDTENYSDNFATMEVLSPVVDRNMKIFPFIVDIKAAFVFSAATDMSFKSVYGADIVSDVMTKTIYRDQRNDAMHTDNAIVVASSLDKKGVL